MKRLNLHFFFFISLFVSALVLNPLIYSQLTGYRAEVPIWVKNNSGTPLTDFPVQLRINTQLLISLGILNSTGRDMRFGSGCSGSTLYPYLLGMYLNTDSTKVTVKIPSIPANDSVLIYMFCGHATDTSQSTYNVYNGPHSSTDSVVVTSPNTVPNSSRGFRFTANSNVLVTHFGKRIPNATQRYVTLWNFTTQQIIKQFQVDAGTSGQYNYNQLDTPVTLQTGQQYILQLFQGAGDMYYFGTSSQIGQHFTYGDMRYCNSCTQNTFPTLVLANYHYGTPDFLYYVVQTVSPAPTNNNLPPADTNTPAAPQNLNAAQGNQSATLSWSANSEFDIDFYKIYRDTVNNPNTAALVDSVSYTDTTYADSNLTNGVTYYYWLKAGDRFCIPRVSNFSAPDSVIPNPIGISNNGNTIPKVYVLYQNYPNPFNPVTFINFDLPKITLVRLTVYDILGKEVDVLVNEALAAGKYKVDWNAENYASGVYFYKIEAGNFIERKKMIVVK